MNRSLPNGQSRERLSAQKEWSCEGGGLAEQGPLRHTIGTSLGGWLLCWSTDSRETGIVGAITTQNSRETKNKSILETMF